MLGRVGKRTDAHACTHSGKNGRVEEKHQDGGESTHT
jgi:hypothetical protein